MVHITGSLNYIGNFFCWFSALMLVGFTLSIYWNNQPSFSNYNLLLRMLLVAIMLAITLLLSIWYTI